MISGAAEISLWEHDGTAAWGPVAIPGEGGGAPVIADLDGDGAPEIGVAGYQDFMVLETDGSIKWSVAIADNSSGSAAASAFDFDADGRFEIVYRDEYNLCVFSGEDGTVLFQAPCPSGTLQEGPIVVDLDGDGSAEIVAPSNNYAFAGDTGINVYGNDGAWAPARSIWNQYAYQIANIYDDGRVPITEANNWDDYNNFVAQEDVAQIGDVVLSLDGPTEVSRGGTLIYEVTADNNLEDVVLTDYWTDVVLPIGDVYPPAGALFGPVSVNLSPGPISVTTFPPAPRSATTAIAPTWETTPTFRWTWPASTSQ